MGTSKKGAMAKDTVIYMLAKGIEGVVGVVTMSVMTYLFATFQMGLYSTVNIAITTIGMVAIQWLVQSVLRYVNKYDILNQQKEFYSTVFSAWKSVNVGVALIALIIILVVKTFFGNIPVVAKFTENYSYALMILGVLWFITYNTSQLMIAMLAAVREAKLNLLLSLITVCGKLGLMWLFCKLFGSRVEWIFLSYFITDGVTSLIGMTRLKIFKYLKGGKGSKEILKELKDYGTPLMGNMITTSVLNKSDIYIITAVLGASAAGIYQTNYSLIATAFTLLSASVMRGSYPTILRTWAEGDKDATARLISEAVRMYLLLAVPATVGVAAVSDVMATALFEQAYVEGHSIMFWVAFGMMFLGLTEYSIKPWELTANTKAIFKRSLIGGAVNVGLNLILIKLLGSYYIASVTTFIGFFVYFLLARYGTRSQLRWKLKGKSLFRILLSAGIMYLAIYILKIFMPFNKINLVLFVFCGMIVYGLVLYISGEVKNEANLVLNKTIKK